MAVLTGPMVAFRSPSSMLSFEELRCLAEVKCGCSLAIHIAIHIAILYFICMMIFSR